MVVAGGSVVVVGGSMPSFPSGRTMNSIRRFLFFPSCVMLSDTGSYSP